MGVKVEAHVGVSLKPSVIARFMRVEIVEDDMDFGGVAVGGHDAVHEVEDSDASSSFLVMIGPDLPGRHIEGREQRGCTVARVVVALSRQSPSVGHFQIALLASSTPGSRASRRPPETIAFRGGLKFKAQ